jgi:hypothetical protein
MSTLSFVHYTSAGQIKAGEELIKNVRQFYPDAFYMVICDKGDDYLPLCNKYNLEYYHSQRSMGYPVEPYGYPLETVLEFWERFYIACFRCKTTHIMYLEEDIKLLKPLTVPDDVEVYGFDTGYPDGTPFTNGFSEAFIQMIRDFSGVEPNVRGYGAEGGTIYKVDTFLEAYPRVREWAIKNYDYVKYNVYPKMGWQDSMGTYFYLLAGKPFTVNPHIRNCTYNVHTQQLSLTEFCEYEYPRQLVSKPIGSKPDLEVLHHWKEHYV